MDDRGLRKKKTNKDASHRDLRLSIGIEHRRYWGLHEWFVQMHREGEERDEGVHTIEREKGKKA